MSRRRVHNGVTYRWTRKGWKPTVRKGKAADWSDLYPAGVRPDPTPDATQEPENEGEGQGAAIPQPKPETAPKTRKRPSWAGKYDDLAQLHKKPPKDTDQA